MFRKMLILLSLSFSLMGNTYFDKVKSYFITTKEQQKQKDLNQIKKHLSNIDYYLKKIHEFEKFSMAQTQMIAIVKNNPNDSLIRSEISKVVDIIDWGLIPTTIVLAGYFTIDSVKKIKRLDQQLTDLKNGSVFRDLRHMELPDFAHIKRSKNAEYDNILNMLRIFVGVMSLDLAAIYKLKNTKFYYINSSVQAIIKDLEGIKAILSKYPENTFDGIIDYKAIEDFIYSKDMSLNLSQYKLNLSKYNFNVIATNSSNVKDYLNFKSIKQELYSIIDKITLGQSKQVFASESENNKK